jgi:hypothetical protein
MRDGNEGDKMQKIASKGDNEVEVSSVDHTSSG